MNSNCSVHLNTFFSSQDNRCSHPRLENMCENDGRMDEDRDWCTESLAVELSSVESAAMAGIMGILRESSDRRYVATGNSRSDLSNVFGLSATDLNHDGALSCGGTGDASVEVSDECSITSYCSASSSGLINGQMRTRASSGATAPPSSPTAVEEGRSILHSTEPPPPFTSLAHNHHKLEPVVAIRSSTGNTTTSNSSNNSHISNHFKDKHTPASPPLSIRIPKDSIYAQSHPQGPRNDVWDQGTHYTHDSTMHMSSGPLHSQPVHQPRMPNYRVDENVDGDYDAGSIASDQSLAVEVESVDEEGTYLSYGGDCEDFAPIERYSSDMYGERIDHHNHHHQQHRRYEYTVEDPDSSGPQTPQSYTYGHAGTTSTMSPPQYTYFYGSEEENNADLPPSPQHLRRPQYRKAMKIHTESENLPTHQQSEHGALERVNVRDHSASPSSIYEHELYDHQRQHEEGHLYRSTTPNNLHNDNNTSFSVYGLDGRNGRSINPSAYFRNSLMDTEQSQHISHYSNNSISNHSRATSRKYTRRRHRHTHAAKEQYIHQDSNGSLHSTLTCTSNHNEFNPERHHEEYQVMESIDTVGTVGKRKRNTDNLDDFSPCDKPEKKSHTTHHSHLHLYNPTQYKQHAEDSLRSDFSTSHDNQLGKYGTNGSGEMMVNLEMHHMHLDSQNIFTSPHH